MAMKVFERHLGREIYGATLLVLAAFLALFGFFDLKSRREEAWLAERFPGYADYRARTKRFIPWAY